MTNPQPQDKTFAGPAVVCDEAIASYKAQMAEQRGVAAKHQRQSAEATKKADNARLAMNEWIEAKSKITGVSYPITAGPEHTNVIGDPDFDTWNPDDNPPSVHGAWVKVVAVIEELLINKGWNPPATDRRRRS